MDGWLKGLVAAACVAVLAAVGYYFWNEHAEAKRIAQYEDRQSLLRGCRVLARTGPIPRACIEAGFVE